MEEGGPFRSSRPADRPRATQAQPAYRQPAEASSVHPDPTNEETPASSSGKLSRRHKRRGEPREGRRASWPLVLVILILGLLALGLGGYAVWAQQQPAATGIDSSQYQAVFLTGGQTYYGKLTVLNNQALELTDIYYLQSQSSSSAQQSSSSSSSDVQLIKLGNEIYGPEDMMVINRSQVLYYQNLNPSGKVTKAILSYQQSH